MRRICVFCGSSPGKQAIYADGARQLAQALVEREIQLVYGGSHAGLMGIIADTIMVAGGTALGVIPQALVDKERAHNNLTQLYVVHSMHERKAKMAELADGFIAMPGGFGTLEEFLEIITWAQLGFHTKPTGLLNVGGYYDGLLNFFNHTVAEGFVRPANRKDILTADTPHGLLDQFDAYVPKPTDKWISERDEL